MARAGSIVLLFILLASALASAQTGGRVVVEPAAADGPPFSGGVLAGDLLYLSGAIGNQPGTTTLRDSVQQQTEQALANFDSVLAAAGMDRGRIVATTIYIADARSYPAIGRVLAEQLADAPAIKVTPTRTVVEADIALPGAALEISAVAARPGVAVEMLTPARWAEPSTGYSWGVRAGDTVFVSGQAGTEPTSGRRGAEVSDETRQALANIGDVLGAAGLGLEHLVSCRVYLADARDFAGMNAGWRLAFAGKVPPTRATLRARSLRADFRVLIQCTGVAGEKRVITTDASASPPFSPALAVGDRLFLSGFVGRGPAGMPADLGAQTHIVLDRLAAHLAAAGMGFEDVVSVEVWLDDVRHYDAMNAVYRQRMRVPPPARATLASRLMSPEARVEIAMIAVRSKAPAASEPPAAAQPTKRP